MGEHHSNQQVKITIDLMWLLPIGLDAAVALIAINRNAPVVLIPFAIATLVSSGAIWWAQRRNSELGLSPPFSGEKITPDSSHAQPAKSLNWNHQTWLCHPTHQKGLTMNKQQQQALAARRTRQKKARAIAFGLITVIVLGLSVSLLISAFSPKTPPAAANTIDLTADMGGFNMKEIRVKAGKPVTIRLTSMDNGSHTDGGGKHQWAVDDFKVSVVAPPLGNDSVTFTPDKPGTYTYYCDICCGGRANPTMQGKLIVEG